MLYSLSKFQLNISGTIKLFEGIFHQAIFIGLLKYFKVDLKISLYVYIHIEIVPLKFRILNPRNYQVIYP